MTYDSKDIVTIPGTDDHSGYFHGAYLIQHPIYGISYAFEYYRFRSNSDDQGLKTKLFDIENGSDIILDNYDPRFYKICAQYGYSYDGDDIRSFHVVDGNRLFVNTNNEYISYGNIDDFEHFYIPPDSVYTVSKGNYYMLVNNTETSVLRSEKYPGEVEGELGETPWIIHDKLKDTWHLWSVSGSQTTIRAFKDQWIGGIIMGSFHRKARKMTLEEESLEMNNRGAGRWNGSWAERNSDKRLFLYNVGTKKYFEFPTEDYYAELLYVDNEELYYRDDDEIYKRRIKAKKLGKPELLIENKYVLNVHWMYKGE
jgi:hypothetical protein